MSHSFQSIALVGNARDLRVAECMLSLANHLHSRGLRALVDPGVGLAFRPDSVAPCPESSFATRAALIIAIRVGAITFSEACERYRLSHEELTAWETAFDQDGMAARDFKNFQTSK